MNGNTLKLYCDICCLNLSVRSKEWNNGTPIRKRSRGHCQASSVNKCSAGFCSLEQILFSVSVLAVSPSGHCYLCFGNIQAILLKCILCRYNGCFQKTQTQVSFILEYSNSLFSQLKAMTIIIIIIIMIIACLVVLSTLPLEVLKAYKP